MQGTEGKERIKSKDHSHTPKKDIHKILLLTELHYEKVVIQINGLQLPSRLP